MLVNLKAKLNKEFEELENELNANVEYKMCNGYDEKKDKIIIEMAHEKPNYYDLVVVFDSKKIKTESELQELKDKLIEMMKSETKEIAIKFFYQEIQSFTLTEIYDNYQSYLEEEIRRKIRMLLYNDENLIKEISMKIVKDTLKEIEETEKEESLIQKG